MTLSTDETKQVRTRELRKRISSSSDSATRRLSASRKKKVVASLKIMIMAKRYITVGRVIELNSVPAAALANFGSIKTV